MSNRTRKHKPLTACPACGIKHTGDICQACRARAMLNQGRNAGPDAQDAGFITFELKPEHLARLEEIRQSWSPDVRQSRRGIPGRVAVMIEVLLYPSSVFPTNNAEFDIPADGWF